MSTSAASAALEEYETLTEISEHEALVELCFTEPMEALKKHDDLVRDYNSRGQKNEANILLLIANKNYIVERRRRNLVEHDDYPENLYQFIARQRAIAGFTPPRAAPAERPPTPGRDNVKFSEYLLLGVNAPGYEALDEVSSSESEAGSDSEAYSSASAAESGSAAAAPAVTNSGTKRQRPPEKQKAEPGCRVPPKAHRLSSTGDAAAAAHASGGSGTKSKPTPTPKPKTQASQPVRGALVRSGLRQLEPNTPERARTRKVADALIKLHEGSGGSAVAVSPAGHSGARVLHSLRSDSGSGSDSGTGSETSVYII